MNADEFVRSAQAGRRLFEDPDGSPTGLLEKVRDSFEVAGQLAAGDLAPQLLAWFPPLDGEVFSIREDHSGRAGDAGAIVEWTYRGVHRSETDKPTTEFNDTVATGRTVTVRGVTMMTVEPRSEGDGEPVFRFARFIDWIGVLGDIGATINWRLAVANEPPAQQ